nr:hypothetical protein [Tanacetum cinerariifolium]
RDDPIHSLGLKIEIPEFKGKVHPDDFIYWLSIVERVFDMWDIPNKLKVKLVAIKLRQYASLWWDHNMIVEEVINEFDKLRMRCDIVEEEEQVVARFLGVLKPEIADIVSLQPYWTYTDVCHLALKVEKHIKAKSLIYDTDVEPELDKPGDGLVYPDRGEALVIQRVLNMAVLKSVDDNSFFIIAVQTPGSGISILLAVGTPSTGSGNLYCQWELSPGSGNALCILFPTTSSSVHKGSQ